MKTRILLITLGAAALTAITFNANAGLLSPRAAGNQIKYVASNANDPDLVAVDQGLALPPRALGNQTATVAGVSSSVTPATQCVRMTASPKAVQACIESGNMSGCTTVAVAPLK